MKKVNKKVKDVESKDTERKEYKKQRKSNHKEKINDYDQKNSAKDIPNHSEYGDPNWYFTDKDLAEQASRFSFQSFIGDGKLISNAPLPTICTLYLNPSLGGFVGQVDPNSVPSGADMSWASDPTIAAVNMISRKLYSRLATKSGRTQSYAPQDVMTLLLAMGEVVSIASHMKRVLGLVFTYNYRNRDFPSQIIRSLGVNPADLFANLSDYRVRFNTVLNLANKIPFPSNISWFAKCAAIYEKIFKDSPDDMAQIYAFVPATTWIIDEQSYAGGTILKTTQAAQLPSAPAPVMRTFGDWINLLQTMIESIMTSSSYNVIFGDILNMCEKNDVSLLHFNIVPEDYSVIPEYNAEILLHIHNVNVWHPLGQVNTLIGSYGISESSENDVFPDPNTNNLIYAPVMQFLGSKSYNGSEAASNIVDEAILVDFPYGNPDLTERIEATRFSARVGTVFDTGENQDRIAILKALADHYVTDIVIWNGGNISVNFPTLINPPSAGYMDYDKLGQSDKFRYFPYIYRTTAAGAVVSVYGEVNYYTKLNADWLKRINDLCFQGLFELR